MNIDFRADLQTAINQHRSAVSLPGTWWSAQERTQIAQVARSARLRWPEPPTSLPEAALVAIRLLAASPATTTEQGTRATTDALLEEGYIELVEVVATTVAVDTFHRLIGVDPLPHLEAQAGEPSRVQAKPRPKRKTAWLPIAPFESPPFLLSLVPTSQQLGNQLAHAMYMTGEDMADPDFRRGSLRRSQIEVVATAVSWSNECFY